TATRKPVFLTGPQLHSRMCALRIHSTDTPRTSRGESASVNRREFLSGAVAVLGATSIRLPIWAQTSASNAGGSWAAQLLLGVDYYPDQTPEDLWEEDARMMAEVGFT